VLAAAGQEASINRRLAGDLGAVRDRHGLPALAGAVVTDQGLQAVAAVGVRKAGTEVSVTVDDLWHLGSDTKAMTAAMIGALVEKGTLGWDTRLADTFPELAHASSPGVGKITLLHLLSHRAGLPANIPWGLIPNRGPTREQRLAVVKVLASMRLQAEPGARYLYSNLGYVLAGAMAEKAADASWEDLMKNLLFDPLGMTRVGFGGLGTPGQIDQPWPHGADGKPMPRNGPDMDNPPVAGPAGRVHCSLADWARFVADQLCGARGEKALLRPQTYERLQTPPFGGQYALGWMVVERPWGGGAVLTHNGSNTLNFATVWVAPRRDFAVLVVTNEGGDQAAKGCDEAAGALIKLALEGEPGGSL
jgi:CubicO group peptidase (beta-lactamase class C family)